MTSYEKGFLTKCAEYGIDGRQLLEKRALDTANLSKALSGVNPYLYSVLGGSLLGGLAGGVFSDKKQKLKNAILGAIGGAALGGGIHYGVNKWNSELGARRSRYMADADSNIKALDSNLQKKTDVEKGRIRTALEAEYEKELAKDVATRNKKIDELTTNNYASTAKNREIIEEVIPIFRSTIYDLARQQALQQEQGALRAVLEGK